MKIVCCSGSTEFIEDLTIINKDNIFYNKITRFEDGEMLVKIDAYEKLENQDILLVQSISNSVNDNIIELLFTIDILKNINVKSIKLLITYLGYSRQDRVDKINESFSLKIISKIISDYSISKLYLINIHALQTTGFFNIPCENIEIKNLVCEKIENQYSNPLLISPDIGNIKNIIYLSDKMNMDYSIAVKYRPKANENKILSLVGHDIEGKDCIIVDDIVDSAGTLCNVAEKLVKKGANNVIAYITHPVLSYKSFERIKNSYLTKLYISNTINIKSKITEIDNKVSIFSIADYVIARIVNG